MITKIVPITDEIFSNLDRVSRLKLKNKLNETEKKYLTEINKGFAKIMNELLGLWIIGTINNSQKTITFIYKKSSFIFHISHIEYAEVYVENEDKYIQIDKDNIPAPTFKTEKLEIIEKEFNHLIGRQELKNHIFEYIYQTLINNKRKEFGLKTVNDSSKHMLFLGNPGTGKTLFAKKIGQTLFRLGLVRTAKFKSVGRSDLVGQHIGESEKKTMSILTETLGGVLFIDEAYSLTPPIPTTGYKDFGITVIETLLLFMEEHRDEIIIIFSGYTKEMTRFLNSNPGLKSRIPYIFEFKDYNSQELWEIFQHEIIIRDYELKNCKDIIIDFLETHNYNGRDIRNLVDVIIKTQNVRLAKKMEDSDYELTINRLKLIKNKDIKLAIKIFQDNFKTF